MARKALVVSIFALYFTSYVFGLTKPELDLLEAVDKGDAEAINATMVEQKEYIDANYEYGGEPVLIRAVRSGSYDATLALLQHKASLTSRDKDGLDPLSVAAANGHVSIAQLLMTFLDNKLPERVNGYSAFHRACMGKTKKHRWTIQMMLEHGVSPTDPTDDGTLPVELTTDSESKEMIQDQANLIDHFRSLEL